MLDMDTQPKRNGSGPFGLDTPQEKALKAKVEVWKSYSALLAWIAFLTFVYKIVELFAK